jgi:hypothetical protein
MSPTNETKHPKDQTYYPISTHNSLRNALEPTVTDNEIQDLVNDGPASVEKLVVLLKESLTVRETAHGPTAPETLTTLYAIPMYATGAESEAYHRLAIARYDEIGEKRSVTGSLYNLGGKLNAQDRYVAAELVLRRALDGLANTLGKGSQQYVGCLRELMRAVGGQGKRVEVQELYDQGNEVLGGVFWTEEDKEMHVTSLESAYKNVIGRGTPVTGSC